MVIFLRQIFIFFIDILIFTILVTTVISKLDKGEKFLLTLMAFLVAIWINLAYLARILPIPYALRAIRLAWVTTPILIVIIKIFIERVFQDNRDRSKNFIFGLLAIFFGLITLFTNLIIKNIYFDSSGVLHIVYTPITSLYLIFIIYFIVGIIRSSYQVKRENRLIKHNALLLGFLIFVMFNFVFNLILPIFFDIAYLYEFGDYSTLILLILFSYDILKKDFFGLKVVTPIFMLNIIAGYLGLDILFFSLNEQKLVKFILLVFVYIPVEVLFIKSLLNEQKQKEKIIKINDSLRRSRAKYRRLARQQKDIIDIMGHEIRTPLTVITQEINLYKFMKDPPSQMLMSSIKNISKAVEHAIRITNTMLETARIDKKRFTLNISKFDLVELLKNSVNMNKKLIKDGDIEFKNKIKADHLEICADKTRIREAVDTIINNAIKYRDPKKDVLKIKVYLKREGNHIQIGIKDNGIGIDPEDIPKLGRKFVRLDSYTKSGLSRPGGTGLGLYVVKSIAKAHKGELIIKSSGLHKGSGFILVIPIGCDR